MVELLRASRALVDELHRQLADSGHPELRPAHGYALQAIAAGAPGASELALGLGVTKQAASQMVAELVRLGYVATTVDPGDGRRRRLALAPRGAEGLRLSGEILDRIEAEWARELPAGTLAQLRGTLGVAVERFGGEPGLRPIW